MPTIDCNHDDSLGAPCEEHGRDAAPCYFCGEPLGCFRHSGVDTVLLTSGPMARASSCGHWYVYAHRICHYLAQCEREDELAAEEVA